MPKHGKRYRKDLDQRPEQAQAIDDALKTVRGFSKPKFDQTVDLVMHLGIDPTQADQMIRGSVSLPNGIGKSKTVIAFCGENDVEACKAAGALEAGGDELVNKVAGGWLDFDVAVSHPSMMGKVGKLGRVLGPQGKMPSPKSGTVTPDVAKAVKEYGSGKLEFRNDKSANIHSGVGKLSFDDAQLKENIIAFVDHIRKLKPASAKGHYLKSVHISGSMTPSVPLAVTPAGTVE
jgi:large subunit ribosomal protein L1